MRRHATVLLLLAALAALAMWLHPCRGASQTRSGLAPTEIAPPDARLDATGGVPNRALAPHEEPR